MKKTLFFIMGIVLPVLTIYGQTQPVAISGKVQSQEINQPLQGITVYAMSSRTSAITDKEGNFHIRVAAFPDTLLVSHVDYLTKLIPLNPHPGHLTILLERNVKELEEFIISSGFEKIPKERSTGSFVLIDKELINRRISTNLLDRLDGVTSGLAFNKNQMTGNTIQQANQSLLTIRGRSTINANPNPLIVIDNFPYEGDLGNVNPNDVESVTLLKDAAAASIWGARAGNGVIVITTKSGKFDSPLKVSVGSNFSVSALPDLKYQPRLSASDYIDIEQFLFSKNHYAATGRSAYSPVVEILFQQQAMQLTEGEAAARINLLRQQDVRNDLKKLLYRHGFNQQYMVDMNGGGRSNKYFLSVGLDKNAGSYSRSDYNRISLNATNTYSLLRNKMELTTSIALTRSASGNGAQAQTGKVYESLLDSSGGNAFIHRGNRPVYNDTIAQGKLLDWYYRPLDDVGLTDNQMNLSDSRLSATLKYRLFTGMDVQLLYQYGTGNTRQEVFYDAQSYTSRDLVNQFTQISYSGSIATVLRRIPAAGIADFSNSGYVNHNLRGQANFSRSWKGIHQINALMGMEASDRKTRLRNYRLYGYNHELETSAPVDYSTIFSKLPSGSGQIPSTIDNQLTTTRVISLYLNASYTLFNRYILSVSARKDASNLFGVTTNQRGIPLGSIGLAWNISKEAFYKAEWLPYLKLRLTNGYTGNLDNGASSLMTISYATIANTYGGTYAAITSPPNPSLRWERTNTLNIGIDFGSKNNTITGSIEYYTKKGKDILGKSPIAPMSGITSFYGNTAQTSGNGVDVQLNVAVPIGTVKLASTFLLNYATDKVTRYMAKPSTIGSYINLGVLNPVEGRPLYSIFSYTWAGLNSSGNPQGILDGKTSIDYAGFGNSANLENLQYNGPANPPLFGSWRNTVSYKSISLSFNITYKYGYYFRAPSISYSSLFSGGQGHPDINNRWQQPGDETSTYVPAFIYPAVPAKDAFYGNSSVLVEKADHIRLQDVQAGYTIGRNWKAIPFTNMMINLNVTNVGMLWKANKKGIDPDAVPNNQTQTIPAVRSFSMGIRANF